MLSRAPIDEPDALTLARRAPWAAAAALGVMVAGAGLFAVSVNERAIPAPKAEIAAPPIATLAADKPVSAATPRVPAAPARTADAARSIFGEPPRLSPARSVTERIPRLKPARAESLAAVPAPRGVMRFASRWAASEDDRPVAFFFAADVARERPPPPSLAALYGGDLATPPLVRTVVLAKGETFVDALRRAGVRAEDRNWAAAVFGEHHNLRRLRVGQEFVLTTAEPSRTLFQLVSAPEPPEARLMALDFRSDAENRLSLKRDADGGFTAYADAAPLVSRLAAIEGRIDGSLYLSAKRQGAPDEVIAELANMFAYDVDFQREIFGGDEFEAIFEVYYDEHGRLVRAGDILYGRLNWRGRQKEKGYYRFQADASGGRFDYFDAKGESARRLLMKTPIDGARLSSGFGSRRHPILGYMKAHKGVDFAAPRGTPIKAAGDGVIERAGPYGSFGNYIRIRHANSYKTAYAHLNAIKSGIRSGARVRQGDIIGYVGTTGRSTGPHLHYEVHLNESAVNPQNLKIATGVELAGAELDRFRRVRDGIDALRVPAAEEESGLLAESAGRRKSL